LIKSQLIAVKNRQTIPTKPQKILSIRTCSIPLSGGSDGLFIHRANLECFRVKRHAVPTNFCAKV